MNLFAIDTSSENISLGILWNDKLIVNYNHRKKFGASAVTAYIDKYCRKFSLNLKNFDAFVVGRGPGSFMGLRISHSIMKALILSTGKPVIAIGSFWSLAYPFRNKKQKIAAISDARKNSIYAATFVARNGDLRQVTKERITTLSDFLRRHRDNFFLTYDDMIRKEALNLFPDLDFYPKDCWPNAVYLLEMAKGYYNKAKFTAIDRLEPLYLHPKTCQIRSS